MADYGKLDFAVSLSPTSAFPIDARTEFESLEEAKAVAATAERIGSKNTKYYYGMELTVVTDDVARKYVIQPNKTLREIPFAGEASGGASYNIGDGLKLDSETNTLSVDMATSVEDDNTKPISASAVYTEIGNINSLLETI